MRHAGVRFDAAFETERQRLENMTAFFEPGTERILAALGVSEGWSVLEVGGGSGNTTDWLCRQVGPSGAVVATDLDMASKVRKGLVDAMLSGLTEDPPPENLDVKPLQGTAPWMRLRVGDYRVVYQALNLSEMQALQAEHPSFRADTVEARKAGEPTGWLVARIVNRRDLDTIYRQSALASMSALRYSVPGVIFLAPGVVVIEAGVVALEIDPKLAPYPAPMPHPCRPTRARSFVRQPQFLDLEVPVHVALPEALHLRSDYRNVGELDLSADRG